MVATCRTSGCRRAAIPRSGPNPWMEAPPNFLPQCTPALSAHSRQLSAFIGAKRQVVPTQGSTSYLRQGGRQAVAMTSERRRRPGIQPAASVWNKSNLRYWYATSFRFLTLKKKKKYVSRLIESEFPYLVTLNRFFPVTLWETQQTAHSSFPLSHEGGSTLLRNRRCAARLASVGI